ncbi:nucleotide-binding alpha-beta plait domain-containing protein [Tanacetum coccineum]
MGGFRSKVEDVDKISVSVFVTNFPESCSAKDLFLHCKQYGHVVDSFIPNKRSKSGKRFGFVKFINVFNEERLVNNLCTAKETIRKNADAGRGFSVSTLPMYECVPDGKTLLGGSWLVVPFKLWTVKTFT